MIEEEIGETRTDDDCSAYYCHDDLICAPKCPSYKVKYNQLECELITRRCCPSLTHMSLALRFKQPATEESYESLETLLLQLKFDETLSSLKITLEKKGAEIKPDACCCFPPSRFPTSFSFTQEPISLKELKFLIQSTFDRFRREAVTALDDQQYEIGKYDCQAFLHRIFLQLDKRADRKASRRNVPYGFVIRRQLEVHSWQWLLIASLFTFFLSIAVLLIIQPTILLSDDDDNFHSRNLSISSCRVVDVSNCQPSPTCQISSVTINARTVLYSYSENCTFALATQLYGFQTVFLNCTPLEVPQHCQGLPLAPTSTSCCGYALNHNYSCLTNGTSLIELENVDPNISIAAPWWSWLILFLAVFVLPVAALFLIFTAFGQICGCLNALPNPNQFFSRNTVRVLFFGSLCFLIVWATALLIQHTCCEPSDASESRLKLTLGFAWTFLSLLLLGFVTRCIILKKTSADEVDEIDHDPNDDCMASSKNDQMISKFHFCRHGGTCEHRRINPQLPILCETSHLMTSPSSQSLQI